MPTTAFAGYPAPFIRETPSGRGKKKQQLLWGDFVTVLGDEPGEWVTVRGRNEEGWIRRSELQQERLLEVNFVDIGQGDGALIVTPDDRLILIDAGVDDHMFRFLSWRFNLRRHPDAKMRFAAAIISHSDKDHYGGFREIFDSPQFLFDTIYHNGLVERAGKDLLGARVAANGREYITDLIDDLPTLQGRLGDSQFVGSKVYPKLLKTAAESGRAQSIRSLQATDRFLPGYDETSDLKFEVCAPVRKEVDGVSGLRWFDDPGKTKNGHSVVLRLVYHDVRILLGGDLNADAESYLLGHYSGLDAASDDATIQEAIVAQAGATFGADVAKACHHGSADFTDLFLRTVGSIATVISSGDNEPYAHPRPDALGAIGKRGRGPRPLIFSTELARSAREINIDPSKSFDTLQRQFIALELATTEDDKRTIRKKIDPLIERSIAVYGMICLRTDGHKVQISYKLERPGSNGKEFDVHLLEPGEDGTLRYAGAP